MKFPWLLNNIGNSLSTFNCKITVFKVRYTLVRQLEVSLICFNLYNPSNRATRNLEKILSFFAAFSLLENSFGYYVICHVPAFRDVAFF